MKKQLFLLVLPLFILSCQQRADSHCVIGGFIIYTTNNCDDSNKRCRIILPEERSRIWDEVLSNPVSPCTSITAIDYKGNVVEGWIYSTPIDDIGSYGIRTICDKDIEPCPL